MSSLEFNTDPLPHEEQASAPVNPLLAIQRKLEIEACPYPLDTNSDVSVQIDIINWLLSQVRDLRFEISHRDDQLTVCRGELHYTENRLEVVTRDKERVLNQAARFQEEERKLCQQNQTLAGRYKQISDELARHKSQTAHLQTQFEHESRKREKETRGLKERLQQVLSDKSKDDNKSFEVLNTLKKSRPESGRAKWNLTGKDELEMYQSLIKQYEEKQRDLLLVTDSMRQALLETDAELSGLLCLSPQPALAQEPLASQAQWGLVLRQKFEALKELVAGAGGDGDKALLDQ